MSDPISPPPGPGKEELEAKWPEWRFWWSTPSAGRQPTLNATRRRRLTWKERDGGLALTLPYGHNSDLATQLQEQHELEAGP